MKKIGIITFHRAHNYGASLQCMALVNTIKNLNKNYEVKVIDYVNKKIEYDYSLFRIDKTNIFTQIKSFISSVAFMKKNMERRNKYIRYIKQNIPVTKSIYSIEDGCDILNGFDCIIAGSDQIWNPKLTGGIDDIYFLNFECKGRKITYAASLGSNKLESNIEEYKKLFNKIDTISVREKNGCDIISKLTNSKIENVLDPTLLVSESEWKKYLDNVNPMNCKYIFVYSPNNIKEFPDIVNYCSKKLDIGIVNFAKKNMGFNDVVKNLYCSDPNDFLTYLCYSDIVIVTSFHAVVFSIIFHKKFWVISPSDNNSRVNVLLNNLDITNRAIESIEDLKNIDINQEIDYKMVDSKLNKLKEKSLSWLKLQLEDNNE